MLYHSCALERFGIRTEDVLYRFVWNISPCHGLDKADRRKEEVKSVKREDPTAPSRGLGLMQT